MVTVYVEGQATQADDLTCDPFPWETEIPMVLRVRWRLGDAPLFDGSMVPLLFEFAGRHYEGRFRLVARIEHSPGEIVCTFVSEEPVREITEPSWISRVQRIFKCNLGRDKNVKY
jgi:hypothetical protein